MLIAFAFLVYPFTPNLIIEIHEEAIVAPVLLPAIPIVPYNPPGHSIVTKSCCFLYFYEENNNTDDPFAERPYLWQSTLIDVTPSGTTKYGLPSYFLRKGTINPPRHMSI